MAINSLTRRMAKRVLYPLMTESGYSWLQSVVKARDIKKGIYREVELNLIPQAVHPGETAIDVGANFGLYSYHLSRALGPEGTVYAFEPIPFTYSCLEKTLRLWKINNVIPVNKGCSNANETVVFTLPLQESGAITAGLSHMGTPAAKKSTEENARTRRVPCQVVRLDDYLSELAPSFVKIDVEGAEIFVLEGATTLIERSHPTIVCEINPWFLEEFGIELERLTGFFDDRGYRLYQCTEGGSLRATGWEAVTGGNYVFVHERRLSRFVVV